jgi:hypothetical protein
MNYEEQGESVLFPNKYRFHVSFSKKFAGHSYENAARYLQARYSSEVTLAILDYLTDKKIIPCFS